MKKRARAEILDGETYVLQVPNHEQEQVKMYLTINHDSHGVPIEVFIRCDDLVLFEHFNAFSIMVSKLLQTGVHLDDLAESMLTVPSPHTAHFIPHTQTLCPSIYARIGHKFLEYTKSQRHYSQQQIPLTLNDLQQR